MGRPKKKMSEREAEVVRFIAARGASSVREVADHFAEVRGDARTTVLTLMERLRDKGYLGRKRVRGVFHYHSTLSETELRERLVGDFIEGPLAGSTSPFVAYLSNRESLEPSEIEELRALLDRLESSSGSKRGRRKGDRR